MSRLKDSYNNKIQKELGGKLKRTNLLSVPRIKKVVVNAGVGRAVADSKNLEAVELALAEITGQAPVRTKAKKSIAGFKLREGMPIGVMATIRGERMYEFIDRLVNVALPRVRDFRGISPDSFDGHGNYSLGIKEHTVFPELIGKDVSAVSLQVNIETTSKNNDEARELLKEFGFPFQAGISDAKTGIKKPELSEESEKTKNDISEPPEPIIDINKANKEASGE